MLYVRQMTSPLRGGDEGGVSGVDGRSMICDPLSRRKGRKLKLFQSDDTGAIVGSGSLGGTGGGVSRC